MNIPELFNKISNFRSSETLFAFDSQASTFVSLLVVVAIISVLVMLIDLINKRVSAWFICIFYLIECLTFGLMAVLVIISSFIVSSKSIGLSYIIITIATIISVVLTYAIVKILFESLVKKMEHKDISFKVIKLIR